MKTSTKILFLLPLIIFSNTVLASQYVFKSGHASLQKWILPPVPYPEDNKPNQARIDLGKMLFFDPRLSGDGNMSCATCHNPMFGWSDGLPTGKGFKSQVLGRASPTVINTAYAGILMWDGRKRSLEDQALGPLEAKVEMHADFDQLISFLKSNEGYIKAFKTAYPNLPIGKESLAKAIASYERTIISNNSPFDRWVKGDKKALSKKEINGFKVFVDPNKGNCVVCHQAPNFTDDGFHNIGLKSFANSNPDLGRYAHRPVRILKGAFKTPTLRDIKSSAPYFHDGSAETLAAVVDHYVTGGEVKSNLSPNMKSLTLSKKEKEALVAFMEALSSPATPVTLPILPL